jgi:hypothetical protein
MVNRPVHGAKRWILAGRPMRPEAEAARIYETICANSEEPCQWFTINGGCQRHGCRHGTEQYLKERIGWATESCPASPPKWKAACQQPETGCKRHRKWRPRKGRPGKIIIHGRKKHVREHHKR